MQSCDYKKSSNNPSQREKRLLILYIFFNVNKSHPKTKTNNVSACCLKTDFLSVGLKPLVPPEDQIFRHLMNMESTAAHCSFIKPNRVCVHQAVKLKAEIQSPGNKKEAKLKSKNQVRWGKSRGNKQRQEVESNT